ncbi:tubulin-specific chaperone E [Nematostella vectensis]|uniref:tubulin-specific chaperone E n=1 Tax=Nematostella vectensis TaxID=45351 RepID=UPI00207714D0|nr:tubulin-specific chaperone E [Nematostella vectensis]
MAEDVLGKRVLCDGYIGTVKYRGGVPPTEGEWYGVEWDDPKRGKHDGSIDGVKYFECRHQTSGSFVREKKVSFGVSVVEALRSRYGATAAPIPDKDMYVSATRSKKKAVEMVGADSVQKITSCFEKLQDVILRGEAINGADKTTRLCDIAPDIQELDISKNLISCWSDVAAITEGLTRLRSLVLSDNHLILPECQEDLAGSFKTIKILYLNKMHLQWDQVILILRMFPYLEELHLRGNNICSLRIDCHEPGQEMLMAFQNMKILDLDDNKITDWNEVLRLGSLPKLDTLVLNHNKISQVFFKEGNETNKTDSFGSLTTLSLFSTDIQDISSLNALNMLQSLVNLKFKNNPLFKDETSFVSRQELIARVASLQNVNNSPLMGKERVTAEQMYIKKYAQEWISAGANLENMDTYKLNKEFVDRHPRYTELIKVYGPPEEVLQKKTSTKLKDALIPLKIICPDNTDKKAVTKKLPGTMTIGKLKGLLYRLYKVDSSDQKISYLDTKNNREIAMDDDLRQIDFYSLAPDDTVFLRW